jgi:hypothetical protein
MTMRCIPEPQEFPAFAGKSQGMEAALACSPPADGFEVESVSKRTDE